MHGDKYKMQQIAREIHVDKYNILQIACDMHMDKVYLYQNIKILQIIACNLRETDPSRKKQEIGPKIEKLFFVASIYPCQH